MLFIRWIDKNEIQVNKSFVWIKSRMVGPRKHLLFPFAVHFIIIKCRNGLE